MESTDALVLLAIVVCILLILGVCLYIYTQIEKTKKYVRDELAKFTTAVNDAQYNEFNFDKNTEKNIKTLEERLQAIGDQLKSMKNNNASVETEET